MRHNCCAEASTVLPVCRTSCTCVALQQGIPHTRAPARQPSITGRSVCILEPQCLLHAVQHSCARCGTHQTSICQQCPTYWDKLPAGSQPNQSKLARLQNAMPGSIDSAVVHGAARHSLSVGTLLLTGLGPRASPRSCRISVLEKEIHRNACSVLNCFEGPSR